ncbi:MAG: CUAEP/CCAEP-tail radical SAM (seleno)protein [Terriglobales bacterium]
MKIVLISTYELGHQPFGLASPAAWLRRDGHEVRCIDTSQQALRDHEGTISAADVVAFYVPMHTATRIAMHAIRRVRDLNPGARLCAYGLYAPMNADVLRELGVEKIIGGEFEKGLVEWAKLTTPLKPTDGLNGAPSFVSLDRLAFITPDRSGLPALRKYSKLRLPNGEERVSGYTEATRGCKHLCRHCPIVPIYNGSFRVVPKEVVLADIRQQVAAGAQHITFGDPDFFNGPTHAIGIVETLHREFTAVSYDVTIKVEHLLKHADLLPTLKATNCIFVVSAVESFDNALLARLDKGHTNEDFFRVVELFRRCGLGLAPTFVPFTPWTTLSSYESFLSTTAALDIVENVSPIQLAIRLLIPAGSRLLELAEIQGVIAPFDREKLCYPWQNPDPRVDELQRELEAAIQEGSRIGLSRRQVFAQVSRLVNEKSGAPMKDFDPFPSRTTIPYLTEPWYC